MGGLAAINTPLRWQAWERALRTHPDEQFTEYLVSGLREGFRVGFSYPRPCRSSADNMHSVREHAQVVRDYLSNECAEGRILGPLSPPWSDEIHVSRFGVIPKGSSGKWRLIVDLSSPEGASVNDRIDSGLCSLKYATVDQAAELMLRLGRGALMAKADIEQAYRRIPVHPDDCGLLGMRFEGATYMDTVLPFGLRSAPKVFNAVADALEWVCRRQGVSNILHYLDDFFTIGAPHTVECISNLAALRTTFDVLGVPLAEHKTVGPATSIVFLGVNLDSCSLQLSLPEVKLRDLKALIQAWVGKKVTTARDLKSLVGKLENACKVVRPGRSFLRRMIDLLRGVKSNRRLVRLNSSFRSDLAWWHHFLSGWNGVSAVAEKYIESAHPDVVVHCDASGSIGCAAWWSEGWLHYEWPPEVAAASITPKETLPVVFACAVWGQLWRNKRIRVYCDNEAAVANLNSGRSKEPWSMHMIRCLFFIKAIYGLELEVLHLPGKMNTLAEALSRNNFAYFCSQVPGARRYQVPAQVLNLLVLERPDWTSVALFANYFQRA